MRFKTPDSKGSWSRRTACSRCSLRVTWEPANASYLCAKRIVLACSDAGTKVEYWDRYTDDQPNAGETAKQVAADTEKAIEAFKKMAEK